MGFSDFEKSLICAQHSCDSCSFYLGAAVLGEASVHPMAEVYISLFLFDFSEGLIIPMFSVLSIYRSSLNWAVCMFLFSSLSPRACVVNNEDLGFEPIILYPRLRGQVDACAQSRQLQWGGSLRTLYNLWISWRMIRLLGGPCLGLSE